MRKLLAEMRQRSVFRVATAYMVAGWDTAIEWFHHAVDRRETLAPIFFGIFLREFTPIDHHPRFQALLERMNLPH